MSPSVTPNNRDLGTAAAIAAVIVAALVLAWQPKPEPPAAETATAAPASASGPATSAGPAFDLDTAMALAGQQVPPDLDSFYFFAMLEAEPQPGDVGELGEKMLAASSERDYLGVAGPDAERNRRTLLAAFEARRGDDLSGMILIYLGPARDRAEVEAAAAASRVTLRYVPYPAEPQPI